MSGVLVNCTLHAGCSDNHMCHTAVFKRGSQVQIVTQLSSGYCRFCCLRIAIWQLLTQKMTTFEIRVDIFICSSKVKTR